MSKRIKSNQPVMVEEHDRPIQHTTKYPKGTPKPNYAYIVVAPNPIGNTLGIERADVTQDNLRGYRFMFWIKVGDTGQAHPKNRLNKYKNPDQYWAIIHLNSNASQEVQKLCLKHSINLVAPGKAIENISNLKNYEQGGIGQADSFLSPGLKEPTAEWHALYAKGEQEANYLRVSLNALLIWCLESEEKSRSVADVIKEVNRSIQGTGHGRKVAYADMREDAQAKRRNEPPIKRHTYWIKIDHTHSKSSTPYQYVSDQHLTETPDLAYNAAVINVQEKNERVNDARAALTLSLREATENDEYVWDLQNFFTREILVDTNGIG
ncbi:hypothetical protein FRC07_003534 [Ceratobasidium sp. 392]|nr:hypothetical protein FRC07_003534 [Ceratobasidium sp. 392]